MAFAAARRHHSTIEHRGNWRGRQWARKGISSPSTPNSRTDQAEREKEAAEKERHGSKTNSIATVSHELRTPLTSITASLDLLNELADGNLSKRAEN